MLDKFDHLDHAWIASHIPHQGNMCLLDSVGAWSQETISCRASSHRAIDNPLRAHGQLGVACGIEYAAQAMAVHGALLAPSGSARPRVGYLVSVRGVTMSVPRLDDIPTDLLITATCIVSNENNILYQFSVSTVNVDTVNMGTGNKLLLEGRATVVLNADALKINVESHG